MVTVVIALIKRGWCTWLRYCNQLCQEHSIYCERNSPLPINKSLVFWLTIRAIAESTGHIEDS